MSYKLEMQINDATVVIVNGQGGSGVLIQSENSEYDYILTAKHVLETEKNSGIYLLAPNIRVMKNELKIQVCETYLNSSYDIAILKIQKQLNNYPKIAIRNLKNGDNVWFTGFPETRRNIQNEIYELNKIKGEIFSINDPHIVVTLQGQPHRDHIVGMSGGGIFIENNEEIYLCGIETQVEGNPTEEHYGRVEFIPIKKYRDLIRENDISDLYPSYLDCFSKIVGYIFDFKNVFNENNVEFLKCILKEFASSLSVSNLAKPKELYEYFNEKILINASEPEDLLNVKLWMGYLEYLTILAILENENNLNLNKIIELSKKRRYLFSAISGHWGKSLREILLSDLKNLEQDGKILINTLEYNGVFDIPDDYLNGIIEDIGRKSYRDLKIDNANIGLLKSFKIYPWHGVHQKCVEYKEGDYSKYNFLDSEHDKVALIEKIRIEYGVYL